MLLSFRDVNYVDFNYKSSNTTEICCDYIVLGAAKLIGNSPPFFSDKLHEGNPFNSIIRDFKRILQELNINPHRFLLGKAGGKGKIKVEMTEIVVEFIAKHST